MITTFTSEMGKGWGKQIRINILGGTINGHKLSERQFGYYSIKIINITAFYPGISLLEFILQIDPMCIKVHLPKHWLKQQKVRTNLSNHNWGLIK